MIGKSSIAILVALVFITGGVSGFFVGARILHEKHQRTAEERESVESKPETSKEDAIMSWMVEFLGLSESQEYEIRPLVRMALKEHDELELEQEARVDALIDRSDIRISKHLSAEQAESLLRHNRERREKRDKYRAYKKKSQVQEKSMASDETL